MLDRAFLRSCVGVVTATVVSLQFAAAGWCQAPADEKSTRPTQAPARVQAQASRGVDRSAATESAARSTPVESRARTGWTHLDPAEGYIEFVRGVPVVYHFQELVAGATVAERGNARPINAPPVVAPNDPEVPTPDALPMQPLDAVALESPAAAPAVSSPVLPVPVARTPDPDVWPGSSTAPPGAVLVYSNTGGTELFPLPTANLAIADDLELIACGCFMNRLELLVGGGGDGSGPGFAVNFLLLDGCPEGGVPIPGAGGSVVLPDDGDHLATFDFPADGPLIPRESWLILWFNTAGAGWYTGTNAEIGFTDAVFWYPGFGCEATFPGGASLYEGFYARIYCQPPDVDCNQNGIADECELLDGTVPDCNTNLVPDECDVADGTSADCNGNGVPDECIFLEDDCNGNDVPDTCDLAAGTSADCNNNGIPDECEADCNGNGIPDDCDIAQGKTLNCNPPAVVFSNTIYPYGLFDPGRDLSNGIFFFRVGNGGWTADDWRLDIGTGENECIGTTLQVAIFGGGFRCHDAPQFNACSSDGDCSVGGCTPSPDFDATVDVFNHDPSLEDDGLSDQVGNCLVEDPDPGMFSTTFANLDGQSAHVLTVDLNGGLIGGPFGAIYARIQTTTDSSGWILGSNADTATPAPPADDAEIGFSDDFAAAHGVLQGFCGLVFFAGFPQFSLWGTVSCVGSAVMQLVPVKASGVECASPFQDPAACDWYIDGPNSITLHRPGQDIMGELFISHWDVAEAGRLVGSYQAGHHCKLFTSGDQGEFRPIALDCGDVPDFEFCQGGDTSRPDFIFDGVPSSPIDCTFSELCADDLPGFFQCGSAALAGGAADDAAPKFAMSLAWEDTNDDARGRFFLGISHDDDATFLRDQDGLPIAPITHVPLQVIVRTATCCGAMGEPFACVDDLLFDECEALGGILLDGISCSGTDSDGDGLDDACPIPGRCCGAGAGTLGCDDRLGQDQCAALGGEFQGEAESCSGIDANQDDMDDACDPLGRCCGAAVGTMGCADVVTAGECQSLGGAIFTVDESCAGADADGNGADDACPLLGSCCFGDGAPPPGVPLGCADNQTPDDCSDQEGLFQPNQRCAGTDDDNDGLDDHCFRQVPTVSEWGLLVLALLLIMAAKLRPIAPRRVP